MPVLTDGDHQKCIGFLDTGRVLPLLLSDECGSLALPLREAMATTSLTLQHPFHSVDSHAKLAPVISFLARKNEKRLAVTSGGDGVGGGRRMTGVVTASGILELLAREQARLDRYAAVTCDDIGFSREVVTVRSDSTAREALTVLVTASLSAAPIVDEAGKLVGNLSQNDIRGLTKGTLDALTLPVLSFVCRYSAHAPAPPLTARPSDTLEAVLNKMVAAKVHRLWLVDRKEGVDHDEVIGVVSATDLLRFLDLRLFIDDHEGEADEMEHRGV